MSDHRDQHKPAGQIFILLVRCQDGDYEMENKIFKLPKKKKTKDNNNKKIGKIKTWQ